MSNQRATAKRAAAEREFLLAVLDELHRSQGKFPSSEHSLAALHEESGELAKACLDEPLNRVRDEAVQVAVMAMRVAIEGDPSLNAYRERKGLDGWE